MGLVGCLHYVSNFFCPGAVLTHVLRRRCIPPELLTQHRQAMAYPGWTAVDWIGNERSLWYCCNLLGLNCLGLVFSVQTY